MLVYATRLHLDPVHALAFTARMLDKWLEFKYPDLILDLRRLTTNFVTHGHWQLSDGKAISILGEAQGLDTKWAVAWSHPDSEHRARRWSTHIGVQVHRDRATCDVVLEATQQFARTPPIAQSSRPHIVKLLAESDVNRGESVGGRPLTLTTADTQVFQQRISDEERTFPIVVVSMTGDWRYLVNPERLASNCVGLAEVYLTPRDCDPREIARQMNSPTVPLHGGVNVIWPQGRLAGRTKDRFTRFEASDLGADCCPDDLVFTHICHRVAPSLERQALTVEKIRRDQIERDIAHVRSEAADAPTLRGLLNEADSELKSYRERLEQREFDCEELQERLRDVESERDGLRQSLAAAKGRGALESASLEKVRPLLVEYLQGRRPSLVLVLQLVQSMFADRCIILPTAFDSARRSSTFKSANEALDLLVKLATDYWSSLVDGAGDLDAGRVFGAKFSATESETVVRNRGAMASRTFRYKGVDVVMLRHLRLGVKESASETWRCHFHWDSVDRKIVIGHCGEHLPLP